MVTAMRPRGMPPQHSRLYSKDEELGKRDDDFKPRKRGESLSNTMTAAKLDWANPLRWRKRRFVGILVAVFVVYFFIRNIPSDLGSADSRINPAFKPYRPQGALTGVKPVADVVLQKQPPRPELEVEEPTETYDSHVTPTSTIEPTGAPPRTGSMESQVMKKQYYDGIIRYYRLAATLNKASVVGKPTEGNHNVLFMFASLKSLANLMPLACAMAKEENNGVHVGITSRSDLSLADINSINNIDPEACPVEFHDARPDYAEYSSDSRHEAAVAGAFAHFNMHIQPHAVITDDETLEEVTFSRAITKRAKSFFRTRIEVPAGKYEEFMYISHLDHVSLSNWHTPTIEIVIHAQKDSAGSLMRLIRTLKEADYTGVRLPKLTIDLATNVQQALRTVLANLKWPPRYEPATKDVDTVTLRHHVQSQRLSTEQAALRFLEAYYPATNDHHVLILSPQVELSSQYLRYLHYTILEYKYKNRKSLGTGDLLGISLDVPARELDGQTFVAPEVADNEDENVDPRTAFLYQAPTASSLLIFGDKWQVFHDYLTHRIDANHLGEATQAETLVSQNEPAWMEYLLELMRARGWHVLYPAKSFATVHNELLQTPEEFSKDAVASTRPAAAEPTKLNTEEPFILAPDVPATPPHIEEILLNPLLPLHKALPLRGSLPKLDALPVLSHLGDLSDMDELARNKTMYMTDLRRRIGGCTDEEARRPRVIQEGKAEDLFCLPTIDMVFDVRAEAQMSAPSSEA